MKDQPSKHCRVVFLSKKQIIREMYKMKTEDMKIEKLEQLEKAEALALVWDVFLEFEAPDYTEEGINTFRNFICDEVAMTALDMYGAWCNGVCTGVIATRSAGSHISLFFVRKDFHRQGIGRKLVEHVLINKAVGPITVNSSPYAVEIYHKLGFTATNTEQLTDGLRYTPMVYVR